MLWQESSRPTADFINAMPGIDKLAHVVVFGVLAILICTFFFGVGYCYEQQMFWKPLVVVVLLGISEEAYQMTVPGRTASLFDLLADISGAVTAIVFFNYVLERSRAKS